MQLTRKIATSIAIIAATVGIGLNTAPSAVASDGNAALPDNRNWSFVPAVSQTNCTRTVMDELIARQNTLRDLTYRYAEFAPSKATLEQITAAQQAYQIQLWALQLHMQLFVEGCRDAMRPIG